MPGSGELPHLCVNRWVGSGFRSGAQGSCGCREGTPYPVHRCHLRPAPPDRKDKTKLWTKRSSGLFCPWLSPDWDCRMPIPEISYSDGVPPWQPPALGSDHPEQIQTALDCHSPRPPCVRDQISIHGRSCSQATTPHGLRLSTARHKPRIKPSRGFRCPQLLRVQSSFCPGPSTPDPLPRHTSLQGSSRPEAFGVHSS